MPPKKKSHKKDFAPHIPFAQAPRCEMPGCREPGAYKAPKSKKVLHEYQWLCLEHVRDYNARWDFFKGMNSDEIEAFRSDAVTGHRPTWNRETRLRDSLADLQDALYEFMAAPVRPKKAPPPVSAKLRKALSLLDLDYPYSVQTLKSRYRAMVKKYHPDVNKSDKHAEEIFKKITESYHALAVHLKTGI